MENLKAEIWAVIARYVSDAQYRAAEDAATLDEPREGRLTDLRSVRGEVEDGVNALVEDVRRMKRDVDANLAREARWRETLGRVPATDEHP